jgi:YD repeat-containing protein
MKFFRNVNLMLMFFILVMGMVSANIEIQSPEAQSFSESGGGSEPGANGGISENIPLGVVSGRGGFDMPLSLSYSPGIRLDQEASWVGLGFSLGFGAITRSPVGVADDYSNGFLNSGSGDYNDQDYYSLSFPGGGGKVVFDDASTPKPYVTGWQSLKIEAFDSSGKTTDESAYSGEIDHWIVTTNDGVRYVFGIDEDSKTYSSRHSVDNYVLSWMNDAPYSDQSEEDTNTDLRTPFISAWYLTHILGPDYSDSDSSGKPSLNDKGNWLRIDYNKETNDYVYKYPNPRTYDYCEYAATCDDASCASPLDPPTGRTVWGHCGTETYSKLSSYDYVGIGNSRDVAWTDSVSLIFSKRETRTEMTYPQRVVSPTMFAEFDYETTTREDGRDHHSITTLGSGYNPNSFNSGYKLAKLEGIEIYDGQVRIVTPSDQVSYIDFVYRADAQEMAQNAEGWNTWPNQPGVATSAKNDGRLTLDFVQIYGRGGMTSDLVSPKIVFDYYKGPDSGAANIPYHKYAWDWWGYNNGEVENGYISLIPFQIYCEIGGTYCDRYEWGYIDDYFEGNSHLRTPVAWDFPMPNHESSNAVDAWSLKKITYSTGGYVEYDYEMGEYNRELGTSLGHTYDAGIRVKSKTLGDGLGNNYMTNYEYNPGVVTQHLNWKSRYKTDWSQSGAHVGNGIYYDSVETIVPKRNTFGDNGKIKTSYDLSKMQALTSQECKRTRKVGQVGANILTGQFTRNVLLTHEPNMVKPGNTEVYSGSGAVEQSVSKVYSDDSVLSFSDSTYDNRGGAGYVDKIDCNGGLGPSSNQPYYLNVDWLKLDSQTTSIDGVTTTQNYGYNNEASPLSGNGQVEWVETTRVTSTGATETVRQRTYYAFENELYADPNTGVIQDAINAKHMLSLPSISIVVDKTPGADRNDLKGTVYKYKFYTGSGYELVPLADGASCPTCPIYSGETSAWKEDRDNWIYGDLDEGDLFMTSYVDKYDKYGQVLVTRDAKGHVTKAYYGSEGACDHSGTFSNNELITCVEDNANNHVTAHYDSKNRVEYVYDTNGFWTKYGYDNMDRLIRVTNSEDDPLIIAETIYNYGLDNCDTLDIEDDQCLNWVQSNVVLDEDTTGKSRSYVDGLGRALQTKAVEDSTHVIRIRTNYNERGLVDNVTEPERLTESVITKTLKDIFGYGSKYDYEPTSGEASDEENYLLKYDTEVEVSKEAGGDQTSIKYVYSNDPLGRVDKVFNIVDWTGDENTNCGKAPLQKCTQTFYGATEPGFCTPGSFSCNKVVDAEGNYVASKTDKLGNTVAIKNADGKVATFDYDLVGALIDSSDFEGREQNSAEPDNVFNVGGQLLETHDLNQDGPSSFTYDDNGNILTAIDASGRVTLMVYDNLDRVIHICIDGRNDNPVNGVCDSGEAIIENFYDNHPRGYSCRVDDSGNRISSTGLLCKVKDNVYKSSIEYLYDFKSRLKSIKEINPSAERGYGYPETDYEYDISGNVKKITMEDPVSGETDYVEYEYNALGQLEFMWINGAANEVEFKYEAEGMLDYIDFPTTDSVRQDFTYGADNLVSDIVVKPASGAQIFNEHYRYDRVGNLDRLTNNVESSSVDFGYDSLYRLKTITDSGYYDEPGVLDNLQSISYTYDDVGNRLTRSVQSSGTNDVVSAATYNYGSGLGVPGNRDRLEATQEGCTYTYDSLGNTKVKDCLSVGGGKIGYKYDFNNLITEISMKNRAETLRFTYDALGRRTSKWDFVEGRDTGLLTLYNYGAGTNPLIVHEEAVRLCGDVPKEGQGFCIERECPRYTYSESKLGAQSCPGVEYECCIPLFPAINGEVELGEDDDDDDPLVDVHFREAVGDGPQ